jgi:hypothetical protein
MGFRVELGEIEEVLQRGTGVAQAVALGWPVNEGTAQGIVAFVSGATVDSEELKKACKLWLSDYMVPSRIIPVDDMPLNANGKIDRNTLRNLLESGEFNLAETSNLLPLSSKIHGVKIRIDPFYLTSRFCAPHSIIPEVPSISHLPFTSMDLLSRLLPDFHEQFA